MPKVSVIMAVYNAESFLPHSIQSILSQSIEGWELICVDDGSVDGSLDYLNSISKVDSRVKVITQKNSGPAQARSRGIEVAVGEYGVTLDADDFVAEDFLEVLYSTAVQGNESAVLCDLMTGVGDDQGSYVSFNQLNGLYVGNRMSGADAFERTLPWAVHGWCLWRMELLKVHAVGENPAINNYNSDEYISRVLFLHAGSIVISSAKYFYRNNPGSITSKVSLRMFGALETNSKLIELVDTHNLGSAVRDKARRFQFLTIFSLQRTLYKDKRVFSVSEKADAQVQIDNYLASVHIKRKWQRLIRIKLMRVVIKLELVVKRFLHGL